MITELLDLAERIGVKTPRPFESMPIHYFIDLTGEGEILGITPVYGRTREKTGEAELGKMIECPAYFPLKIKDGTQNEILASAGGGISVAEAGHGDVREIFCTEISKSRKIVIIAPPADGLNEMPEAGEEDAVDDAEEDSSDQIGVSDSATVTGKNQYYRHDGWLKQIRQFSDSLPDIQISKAMRGFFSAGHRLSSPAILSHFSLPDPTQAEANALTSEDKKKAKETATKAYNAQLDQIAKSRFTFRINGEILVKNRDFKKWWATAYARQRDNVLSVLPSGRDGFSVRNDEGSQGLTPVFPHIPSVPSGGTYCPLASFDKAATQSFGLAKHTLSMSLTTTERVAASLKWLLQDERSHCTLGKKVVAVFWAIPSAKGEDPCSNDFVTLINEPDALQVLDFLRNMHGYGATGPNAAKFYCAILSSPKSRITVRSWHSETLERVKNCAKTYFETVCLPDAFDAGHNVNSTLGEMATAVVPFKSKSGPAPSAYSSLLKTALFSNSLPYSFLESAVSRQGFELAKGFTDKEHREFESRLRARTALIKLHFKTNKDITMNEQTHIDQDHTAYLCGRVLALLDKIHNAAHGKSTASSPAGRYYGSASSSPALVFPRLCKLARIHLEKIDNKGWAYNLDRELADVISKFSTRASWPRTLSLEDQGRFAIGFYYERAPKDSEPTTVNDRLTDYLPNQS